MGRAAVLSARVRPANPRSDRDYVRHPINYPINDNVFVNSSPIVSLVSGGAIAEDLYANNFSTVNVSGGSIGGYLVVSGSSAVLNVTGSGLRLSEPLADGTPINNRVYLLYGAQLSQVHLLEANPFAALCAQVQALAANGTLSKGNASALLSKLDAAQTALQAGDTQTAADSLTAFINQVQAFVRTGKLSAAAGRELIAGAQAILDDIE